MLVWLFVSASVNSIARQTLMMRHNFVSSFNFFRHSTPFEEVTLLRFSSVLVNAARIEMF